MREIWIKRNTSLRSPWPKLSKVLVTGCDGLKDLTWLLFAPNLTHLNVWSSSQLEEIISQDRASKIDIFPFRKLEHLHLWDLPEVKSIYWGPLPFPCLSQINVQNNCQKLRKLPLDSQSCIAGEELVIQYGYEEWKEKSNGKTKPQNYVSYHPASWFCITMSESRFCQQKEKPQTKHVWSKPALSFLSLLLFACTFYFLYHRTCLVMCWIVFV